MTPNYVFFEKFYIHKSVQQCVDSSTGAGMLIQDEPIGDTFMKIATLGFMVRDGYVLLAEKKKAEIGTGTLNGGGGKQECGESLEECLVRENKEEIGVIPTEYEKVAIIRFFAGDEPDFMVHIYLITAWEGEPRETTSMHLPAWYSLDMLPYERMLESDREWLGKLFAGEKFRADMFYAEQAKRFIPEKTRYCDF